MTELKEMKLLGEKIRNARNKRGISGEYVAMRLGLTKGFISKVESGKVRINPKDLRNFSLLIGWDETELEKALLLLGEPQQKERGRQKFLSTIEQQLKEIEELTGKEGTASLLNVTLREMHPSPTSSFLQFLVELTKETLLRLKKGGSN